MAVDAVAVLRRSRGCNCTPVFGIALPAWHDATKNCHCQ